MHLKSTVATGSQAGDLNAHCGIASGSTVASTLCAFLPHILPKIFYRCRLSSTGNMEKFYEKSTIVDAL